jgi:hypothetical protein
MFSCVLGAIEIVVTVCSVKAESEYYVCFKTSKTATEICQLMKQAYGDNTVFHTWVF